MTKFTVLRVRQGVENNGDNGLQPLVWAHYCLMSLELCHSRRTAAQFR